MLIAKRSLQNVRTMSGLSDRRRSRTTSGALLEMSSLANEKERLNRELLAAQRRRAAIEARLHEIAEKETRLHQFIKEPALVAGLTATRAASEPPPKRVKARELRY